MFNSVGEIKVANAAAGQHYFKPDTMRWLGTKTRRGNRPARYPITLR